MIISANITREIGSYSAPPDPWARCVPGQDVVPMGVKEIIADGPRQHERKNRGQSALQTLTELACVFAVRRDVRPPADVLEDIADITIRGIHLIVKTQDASRFVLPKVNLRSPPSQKLTSMVVPVSNV